jgi:transcriptional regulator with XRE-family HTH domain
MTGDDIRSIRAQLALTPPQFADLVGASPSTVYRWEQTGAKAVAIDPGQLRLLLVMKEQFGSRGARALASRVAAGIRVGGGLLGLYHVLHAVYADADGSKGKRRPRARP